MIDRVTNPELGRHRARLARTALLMVIALVIQFGIGMVVNLFVKIPDSHPGANPPEYFGGVADSIGWAIGHGPLALATHVGLGLFLVLVSLWLIVTAVAAHDRRLITFAVSGALLVNGAAFNGGSFLAYNKDLSSLLMALLFAVAVLCYVGILYALIDTGRASAVADKENPRSTHVTG
jgi:hypothetical protein